MNTLYILCGIPFSGKTTLAKRIVQTKGYERVDLDEIKIQLFGLGVQDDTLVQLQWDKIYNVMYEQIRLLLEQGKTVVHDTGNFTSRERRLVKDIAIKLGVEFQTIFVNTTVDVAYSRLKKNRTTNLRFDVSDYNVKQAIAELEIPTDSERPLILNEQDDLDQWISKYIV